MVDTPLSQAQATRERVLHDARAVLDVSEFEAAQMGMGVWVVLRVMPAPHSGAATTNETVLDGDTGRLVDQSGAEASLAGPAVVRFEGAYEITSALSGPPPPASGRYSWREQQPAVVRGMPREYVYNPFARGGTVLCQLDPAAGETTPFSHVSLLPEGFDAYVQEAARAASELTGGVETIDRWLASRNPLLSTQAVRELARRQRLDEPSLRSMLETADGYIRAVLYFTALRDAQYLGAGVLRAGFDADFAQGSETDHRRAAALALLTAQLFAPQAAASIADQIALRRDGGLLAAAAIADEPYVRETIAVMTPA